MSQQQLPRPAETVGEVGQQSDAHHVSVGCSAQGLMQSPPFLPNSDKETAGGGSAVDVMQTSLPDKAVCTEHGGGQPEHFDVKLPTPDDHETAANDSVTIRQALQSVVLRAAEKSSEESDGGTIKAAEKRPTGSHGAQKNRSAQTARPAADHIPRADDIGMTTLSDILQAARVNLSADKALKREDGNKRLEAGIGAGPSGHSQPAGVVDTMLDSAAERNGQLVEVMAPASGCEVTPDVSGQIPANNASATPAAGAPISGSADH